MQEAYASLQFYVRALVGWRWVGGWVGAGGC